MKVAIIGAGPSGVMAAIKASENAEVYLFEKNEKIGKKLFITGKGRCNITNDREIEEFFPNILRNPKFLYSSLYTFTNKDLISFFNSRKLKTKVERGGRVFPESDKSSDVIKVLEKELTNRGVKIFYNSEISQVEKKGSLFTIQSKNKSLVNLHFDKLIIATGGRSYPLTGSSGQGYKFAKSFGHKVTKTYPGLVAFDLADDWTGQLAGVSLKNIELTMKIRGKEYSEFGEMLFTQNGISGPCVLSLSSYVGDNRPELSLDFKPALSREKLDDRILREFDKAGNKELKTVMESLLIKSLISVFFRVCKVDERKKTNQIKKDERDRIVEYLKNFPMKFKSLADFNQAIITVGGVSTKEINPSTLESKLVEDLYFCGEIIDVDGLTGGYNLQIAFSTGYLAGESIKDEK